MKYLTTLGVLIVSLAVLDVAAEAQQFKFPFGNSKRSATPSTQKDSVELSTKDGPWLIMCASFVGPDAEAQAYNLASELRTRYKIKAHTFAHSFDYSQPVKGIGWEVYEKENGAKDVREKQMRPIGASKFQEIAVLVGDFPSVDDARAQRALEKIKKLKPQSVGQVDLSLAAAERDIQDGGSQRLRMWREAIAKSSSDPNKSNSGPLRAAFLLTNPLLPDEYFQANRVDHFVLNLNKNIEHSLLKNDSPYSVRVATFRGDSTFNLNEIDKFEAEQGRFKRSGKGVKTSKLAIAAAKAHRLTMELRKLGVEAYEFHDRHESFVCIGQFDWVSRQTQDGRTEFNQDVVKVVNTFKAQIRNDLPGMPGAVAPRVLPNLKKLGIAFDSQPVPVVVPREQTVTAARGFGNWR